MVSGLAHVAIGVKDLERCIAFYREVLGFTVTHTHEAPNAIRMVLMSLPGQGEGGRYQLELLCFPQARPVVDQNVAEVMGFKHMAFAVKELDVVYNKLLARGAKVLETAPPRPPLPRRLHCTDPEGNRIELVEQV